MTVRPSAGAPAGTTVLSPPAPPAFAVVSGAQVHEALRGQERQVVDLVEQAYRLHAEGATVNPRSTFLRFPDQPADRIIALPASLGGDRPVHGLKWIASFPGNVESGLPRASAVLVLNDHRTGYPFACLEGSIISAHRTAASAALAAAALDAGRGRSRVGFLGTGLIARHVHRYLVAGGWSFRTVGVHDSRAEHADGFRDYLTRAGTPAEQVRVHRSAEQLVRSSDLVVLATTAARPHLGAAAWFEHGPVVLHLSLRDLAPDVVLAASNVVDDADHCLTAQTSLHLTEQRVGHRDFVTGTLHDVLTGAVEVPAGRPVVFSPFGLGILDVAVGRHVHDRVAARGELRVVADFFHELRRYG